MESQVAAAYARHIALQVSKESCKNEIQRREDILLKLYSGTLYPWQPIYRLSVVYSFGGEERRASANNPKGTVCTRGRVEKRF